MKTYVFLSLILLCVLSGWMYYGTVLVDTQAYVLSAYYLQGKQLQDYDIVRVTESYAFKRPVEIILASFIEPIVGVRQAYSAINLLILIATTLLFYYYAKKLFKDENHAYISAVLFAVSLPVILYASRVLVDAAGYLILIIGLIAVEWVLEKKEIKWHHHAALAVLFGFFLLVRDTIVILYIYYFLRYLIKEQSMQKIINLWPFIFTLLPQLLFMVFFNVSFLLSGKSSAITAGKYSALGWLKFFIVHIAAFHLLYIFALFAKIKEKIHYVTYAFSAFMYLAGIQLVALTSPRFSMVLFPVLIPLATLGICAFADKTKHPQRIIFFCVCIYAIFSFMCAWLYPAHNLIAEDAGGTAVIQAFIHEIKYKLGGLL